MDTVVLSLRSGYLYTCNETAADFLVSLDGKRTIGDVADLMVERYEVTREELTRDLLELAATFLDEGLVRVVDGPEGDDA
jgi:hypothetical protein